MNYETRDMNYETRNMNYETRNMNYETRDMNYATAGDMTAHAVAGPYFGLIKETQSQASRPQNSLLGGSWVVISMAN